MKYLKIFTITSLVLLLSFCLKAQDELNGNDGSSIGMNIADSSCHAAFTAIPDSLTSFPFLYHFENNSTGNINSWNWDFGDGSTSTEKSPSHQYEAAGTYNICLTVKNLSDPAGCSDQRCQDLVTLEYFSLGGLVYAGEYPLNNPEMAGDTGIASLYRIVNNQVTFVEDHYFQDYGYYWFGYLFPGDYIVKIGLTEGSTHYKSYFTTYYGDEITWTKADLLSISTTSYYDSDIHLKPVQFMSVGTGSIKGYVNFEQGSEYSMPPISSTTVILLDANRIPLEFTRPGPDGYFEFSAVPFGTYFLTADATGKPANIVTFALSESAPSIDGINLTIFGGNIFGIREAMDLAIFSLQIYPNPVIGDLNVKAFSPVSTQALLRITDITGKVFYSKDQKLVPGFNQISIPSSSFTAGIYLLMLQPEGSAQPIMGKFIR
jgi:hypothetical protein